MELNPKQKILLVDDEDSFRERLVKAFARRGFAALGAADFEAAMALIRTEQPEMAVIDLRMPGKSGLELIAAARRAAPELRMVVLTGYGSIATAIEAVKMGALAYLPKPADVDEIISAFSREPGEAAANEPTEHDLRAPSLARAEWEHINRVLNDCDGNISLAAQRLGLHRRTLQRKLHKYPPRQ